MKSCPELNKKEKQSWVSPSISLCFLTVNTMWPQVPASETSLPLYTQAGIPNNPFFSSSCYYQVFCHSSKKNKYSKIKQAQCRLTSNAHKNHTMVWTSNYRLVGSLISVKRKWWRWSYNVKVKVDTHTARTMEKDFVISSSRLPYKGLFVTS